MEHFLCQVELLMQHESLPDQAYLQKKRPDISRRLLSRADIERTMPTFAPGWNSVPLCLTMMLPGEHTCPRNSFMPSSFGRDPPLFWVDPPCFFDALPAHM